MRSRVARRIVLALLLAALVPLAAAVLLALGLVEVSLGVGLNETVRRGLSNDLPLYRSLFDAKKAAYNAQAAMLAADPALARLLPQGDVEPLRQWLSAAIEARPELARITLRSSSLSLDAARQVDPGSRPLVVALAVAGAADATLELEFRLPGRFVKGLDEARALAETYEAVSVARDSIIRNLLASFVAVLLVVLAGAVLAGSLLARGVTRRVALLAGATRAVAEGDMTVRVETAGNDEITQLGAAFNAMVQELAERRDRIVYLEKISGWQEVARRLAHEIKNPLTPIWLAMQQLDEKKPSDNPSYAQLVKTAREIVEEEIGALRHLVEEFSAFARLPQVTPEPVDASSYWSEALQHVSATDEHLTIEIEVADGIGTVAIDRMMMRHVVSNLVSNAVDAQRQCSGPARIRVVAARHERTCVVQFDDGGQGVPAELADRVFEPYVTTKEHGTGLGLAIVKKIVLQHGGAIAVRRAPELGGARFELRLPLLATTVLPTPSVEDIEEESR